MKNICLIGLGYWGNILLKTLIKMGEKNITICEKDRTRVQNLGFNFPVVSDYKKVNADYYFVATPAEAHYPICEYLLKKNKTVFCEKPLCLDKKQVHALYRLKGNLFVDWVFLYNEHFNYIRQILPKLGDLKSIEFNRLNYGPVRYDVGAFIDLSSHDISMLCALTNFEKRNLKIINYKINNKSVQNDSNICFLNDKIKVLINTSWEYNLKNRDIIFNFDKNILVWDDITQTINLNGKLLNFKGEKSPLENSIETYFKQNENDYLYNKTLTLRVSDIILG